MSNTDTNTNSNMSYKYVILNYVLRNQIKRVDAFSFGCCFFSVTHRLTSGPSAWLPSGLTGCHTPRPATQIHPLLRLFRRLIGYSDLRCLFPHGLGPAVRPTEVWCLNIPRVQFAHVSAISFQRKNVLKWKLYGTLIESTNILL